MRRRFGRYLPMVAMALLVQLLAPIGAFRAVALAVSDPLAMAERCAGVVRADADAGMPAGDSQHGGGACCAVCGAGLATQPALASAAASVVAWPPKMQRVVWLRGQPDPSSGRAGAHAQARAPPPSA